MRKSSPSKSVSPKTAIGMISVVVFLGLLAFLMVQQVNFLVGRSLLIAFGNDADSTYKGAWLAWDGDLVAKDFRLKPYGPDVDVTLRFDTVRVDTPGWLWVLGTMRSRKLVADTDRLHVTLTGGDANDAVDPSLGDLGPFGTATASPFEAEGCMRDTTWLRSELTDMGLSPGPTTLDFDYRVSGTKLASTITLETPGVSKATLVRNETLPSAINPYLLDLTPTVTTDERWVVEDQGFVKARNAFCAERDKTTPEDFVLRHVASVRRLLATRGLAVDDSSAAAYADFSANGGRLSYGGNYAIPLPSEAYYEARDAGLAFARMNAVVERNGRRIPVQMHHGAARPLAGYEEMATYAAMVKEQGGPVPGAPAIPPAAVAAAPAMHPAPAPVTAPPAATPEIPAAAAAASVATPAAPAFTRGDAIAWKDFPKIIGRDVEITTMHTPMREVTVLEAGPTEIMVEGSVQGGTVKNRIHPDGFIRAVLVR